MIIWDNSIKEDETRVAGIRQQSNVTENVKIVYFVNFLASDWIVIVGIFSITILYFGVSSDVIKISRVDEF